MPKKIAIFSGLIYSDRYYIYSNFPTLIKDVDVDITVYTNVKNNCKEFESKYPNHPNLKFSYFEPKDLFYHRLTFFIRRLNDKLHDHSSFGSKTRKYFNSHLYQKKETVSDKVYKLFLPFNGSYIRFISRNCNLVFHKLAIKKNLHLDEILKQADLVFLNWSYNLHNQSIASYCNAKKIPFVYHVMGFDNITTKPRFIFKPSAILTWSLRMNNDIARLYPEYKGVNLTAIGNIQFDILSNSNFFLPKKQFLNSIGFEENKFTITFGLGSPNLFKEEFMLVEWLDNLDEKLFDKIQIIVRPHPAFKINNIQEKLKKYLIPIFYQNPNDDLIESDYQSNISITNWINTIKHSDLLINTSSTLSLDFSFFDKPVININYDASPNKVDDMHIKAVQKIWEHFVPIIDHEALYIADCYNDINEIVKKLLTKIDEKSKNRVALINDICLSNRAEATFNYINFLKNN